MSTQDTSHHPTKTPELSAVVVAGAMRDRAQRTIDGLGRQTALDRIEALVIDTRPELAPLGGPAGLALRQEPASGSGAAAAQVLGARLAGGRIVAYIEDHAAPGPGWAAAILGAFAERPRGAVGYAFRNANPERWISRAGFLADYVTWAEPLGERPPTRLPCNNCAYDRQLLLARSERLETLIASDVVLHEELRKAGHELYTEPGAVAEHENHDRLAELLAANFHHCRLLASRRVTARELGPPARLAWAVGAALLVPGLKLGRDLASLRGRPSLWSNYVQALPIVTLVHIWASAGEALGYLSAGDAERQFNRYELDLERATETR